ncbi:MAG: Uma2 family endonuclease [Planctomycetaceae bacterium]|nr:Uma2 family endonuclease [Planctomycetaceae bacterium]
MATVSTNSIVPSVPRATFDDLYRVEGKAELINGRIVRYMPTGDLPSAVSSEILVALRAYAKRTGVGVARGDNTGYALRRALKNGRLSFSPDASYYDGPLPANRMRFIEGVPTFAVEVRSEGDYTPAAEREIAAKRADYFEAGTLVVWDVDPQAQTIHAYTASAPTQPTVFRVGDIASAELAVPGWTVAVAEIFAA